MIYVTGDTHAEFSRFVSDMFKGQSEMTKEDYVIICGDFGGVWNCNEESAKEKWWMDWFECKPFTTLFVDGNHENFDRLYRYPVEEWNGGKVHKIRPSVIHLMRGQVFTIDGKKIFTFGGARSHDISGGILDLEDPDFERKRKELDRGWKPYRINHLSWWTMELPTKEEMEEGLSNLEKANYEVDYVITHCCASDVQNMLEGEFGGIFETDCLTEYFQVLERKLSYKKWYCGHYHMDKEVGEKHVFLYHAMIPIGAKADLDNIPVPGRPRYARADMVKFRWKGDEKIGKISGVDAYGTFEQSEEPSYDIYVEDNGIYKHIVESEVLGKLSETKEENK